jgi:hypothetical protein
MNITAIAKRSGKFLQPELMEEQTPLIPGESVDAGDIYDRTANPIKYSFFGLLFVSIGLLVGALTADHYFSLNVKDLKLPKPDTTDFLPTGEISATLHLDGIHVSESGSSAPTTFAFVAGERRLDDGFFERFDDYIVSLGYTGTAWKVVAALLYSAIAIQVVAALMAIVFREFPTTLSFKSGSRFSSSWRGALPVWLMLLSCITAAMGLIVINSSGQSVATRFAFYAVRTCASPAEVADLEAALDRPQPRTYLMDTLRIIGRWFGTKGGIKWALSQYLIVGSLLISLLLYVAIFFLDSRVVRAKLNASTYSIETHLKRLPRHCRVLPIWASAGLFVIANLVTKFAGRYANNTGRALNRLPWTARIAPKDDIILSDVFSNYTRFFWIQPALLMDSSFLAWVPLISVTVLGSLNKLGLASKFIEVYSHALLFRAFAIMATILPSAMTLVQRPICYEDAQMSWGDMMTTTNFCNDMMFSGHSTGTVMCACTLISMLLYGPYRKKIISISLLVFLACLSMTVILVGRFHFSADIIVAIVVCVLNFLIHAPAFKLFFEYHKLEVAAGSHNGVARVAGELERVATDIEALLKNNKVELEKSDWTIMEKRIEKIRLQLQELSYVAY